MSTFYRKYRPSRFADVIGQETAVTVLTQSLVREKVAHAYLLTGPRGTGKTTLARLFAQALNCSGRKRSSPEPCGKCPHCLALRDRQAVDIVEIDAASHTGVDHIRELRDTIATAPVLGSHKVYIIDEAHMLSIGAWNALLKTLEEPPAHVVFVLATTNAGKVPETILSRSLRLDLKRFPLEELIAKLERIAAAEKLKISREALTLIARSAQGGMRDAEVLFTQIATLEESPIDVERVAILLGQTTPETIHTLLRAVGERDLPRSLALVRTLGESGTQLLQFTESLLRTLRQALYASVDPANLATLAADLTALEQRELQSLAALLGSDRIVECLERFQEAEAAAKYSPLPELPLEIALVKLIPQSKRETPPEDPSTPSASAGTPAGSDQTAAPFQASPATPPKTAAALPKTAASETLPSPAPAAIDFSRVRREWRAITEQAKAINASLGVALSTADIDQDERGGLTLKVKYPFHQDRLEKPENRLTLDTAFATILGFRVPWRVQVAERQAETKHPPLVSQALEALGGQLVTENN